jgi:molybdopterin-containing oxidoreductase family iron-sulfur binding subunit
MKKVSRRTFLYSAGMMGTALAGGGETIVNRLTSYANPPLPVRPGVWSTYATVCRECPAGCGLHLRFRDGRVTKAEGNPEHPVNKGCLCGRGQSCVQGLYDPDRLHGPSSRPTRSSAPAPVSWDDAFGRIGGILGKSAGRIVLIADVQTGSLAGLMRTFCDSRGSDRLLFSEPFGGDALRVAHDRLFGLPEVPAFRLETCDFIVSFAADFLETWISPVEFSRGFAGMHALRDGSMGRFVYAGPRLSMTAANADDFFLVPPGSERFIALAMVEAMVRRGWVATDRDRVEAVVAKLGGGEAIKNAPLAPDHIVRLARAFVEARASVALAGPPGASGSIAQDTATAAALLNYAAGRVGRTVDFSSPHALGRAGTDRELESLVDRVTPDDVVIIHNSNLAYTHRKVMKALGRAGTIVYLATLADETALVADWVLPIDSPLESWGDYEPYAGVHGLMQPTMRRLYDTKASGDILLSLARSAGRPLGQESYQTALVHHWQSIHAASGEAMPFERFWERSLRQGGYWKPSPAVGVALDGGGVPPFAPVAAAAAKGPEMTLFLSPSLSLHDGRLANRGWLQEAPHPVNGEVWGSAVDIHPATARTLAVGEGDTVAVRSTAGSCRLPVRVTADVAEGTAAITLGQGHTAPTLTTASGVGANGFDLFDRTASGSLFGTVTIDKTDSKAGIVATGAVGEQFHRSIVQAIGLAAVRAMGPGEGDRLILPLPEGYDKNRDLFPRHPYRHHRWAMVADLHRCTGCGACSIACQAENNIPVVGRKEVENGREMAWLKVAPYRIEGTNGKIGWLPLFCQQCDAAPCETVCPVFAAYHNDEGLNGQIYNRCIGTRYCSNNCPYKVRRFNWKNIAWKPPLDKQLNPEVTVRCRGVMEKCTFCIQRIVAAEYRAKLELREVRDNEIQPACVQTCPTRALVFGDLLDPGSAVSRITRDDPRRYHLLEELNTKPAVTFLRRVIHDAPV